MPYPDPPYCQLGSYYDITDFKVGTPSGVTISETDTNGILKSKGL